MKSLLIVLSLLVGTMAHASNERALNLVLKKAEEQVSNGFAALVKFDAKKFSAKKDLADLKKEYSDKGDCKYNFDASRRNNLELLSDSNINADASIPAILRRLYEDDQILAIQSATWDGTSGDGEYCMIYDFNVYTVDGWLLRMEFNYTD